MSLPSPSRVIVGLSGGVDSAVAALLLKEDGWDVQGLFMSNWDDDDAYCTSAADYQDARAVAQMLEIPLHRVSFAAQYRAQVFEHFLQAQRDGLTPNPDVLCNREIKFGVTMEYVKRLGAGWFATGHYARLVRGAEGVELHKARDHAKDQSYFLHAVPRAQFEHVMMPLGEMEKAAVRQRARRAGLPVFDKPDSTGICFIGERPFREFLSRFLHEQEGPIETLEGERVGTHRGLAFYTLGQREGLQIGGRSGRLEQPWYVSRKDSARNALIVVQGHDHASLSSTSLIATRMHWLSDPPAGEFRCGAKVRYRQADQAVQVEPLGGDAVRLTFDSSQRAVTPGQFAVLYTDDRCLGGGVIESVSASENRRVAA